MDAARCPSNRVGAVHLFVWSAYTCALSACCTGRNLACVCVGSHRHSVSPLFKSIYGILASLRAIHCLPCGVTCICCCWASDRHCGEGLSTTCWCFDWHCKHIWDVLLQPGQAAHMLTPAYNWIVGFLISMQAGLHLQQRLLWIKPHGWLLLSAGKANYKRRWCVVGAEHSAVAHNPVAFCVLGFLEVLIFKCSESSPDCLPLA